MSSVLNVLCYYILINLTTAISFLPELGRFYVNSGHFVRQPPARDPWDQLKLRSSTVRRLHAIQNFGTVPATKKLLHGEQAAGVRGILMCDNTPAANVKVKLYDDDRGIDLDDLLDSGKSDSRGHFELRGYTSEFTTIDPKLNIYHDCNDGVKPCQRKFTIIIPKDYVSPGQIPLRMFDIGTLQLAGQFPNEGRDCLNRFLL